MSEYGRAALLHHVVHVRPRLSTFVRDHTTRSLLLEHTFCHLPGVGLKTEARLWEAGVHAWEDLLAETPPLGGWPMGPGKLRTAREALALRREEALAGDFSNLLKGLPAGEHWRLYPRLRHAAAFLDIETTGTGAGMDHITTIALQPASTDGGGVKTYVHGVNMEAFLDDVQRFDMLVTFNGKCFDVPFIEREFGVRLPHAHLDLRFALQAVGVRGGLKNVERSLGLSRGNLDGVDGYWAVLLWNDYQTTSDPAALETLLAYNVEDVITLELLAATAFNLHVSRTPFAHLALEVPAPGLNPHIASEAVLERIRARHFPS